MNIAFFDSGIGGVTVLHEALKMLPSEDYIYFADTLNAPYGTKSREEVRKLVFNAVDFIVSLGVSAVVIACNTATSVAIEDLRKRYTIPIIGMEPAVKPAVEKSGGTQKRVLVTATPLTIKEEKLKNLIDRIDNEHIVDLLPLPGLVHFAENFEFRNEIAAGYLKKELAEYDMNRYGTIVLGCTHFLFYRNIFKRIIPEHIDIIDGNIGTINHLKKVLDERGELKKGKGEIKWYCSGSPVADVKRLAEFELLMLILDTADKSQI
ncbi:MAG TPA: glutamate racemase [Spirochaetota bacterium]|nr:glutamate racemase [Spirochaetota bacterium]HPS87671.1 glutamate racemase [Spirochaetota bacterium]